MSGLSRTSDDLSPRRRKILYHAWHRGTRELDLLLGRFADHAADVALDKKRGEAIAKALTDAGASADKTKVEHAGARAPVFDPADAKRKDRNARVEIV